MVALFSSFNTFHVNVGRAPWKNWESRGLSDFGISKLSNACQKRFLSSFFRGFRLVCLFWGYESACCKHLKVALRHACFLTLSQYFSDLSVYQNHLRI